MVEVYLLQVEDPPYLTVTEEWTGAGAPAGAWTTVNSLNTARSGVVGAKNGTQTAGLVYGSYNPPPAKAFTESWNGTNWTEVNDLNNGRSLSGSGGTQTAAIMATVDLSCIRFNIRCNCRNF